MKLERKRSFIFCQKYKSRKRRNIYICDLVLYQRCIQHKCIIDNNAYFTAKYYGKSTFSEVSYISNCFFLKSRGLESFYEPRCLLLTL